jgi:hypothetical protein
MAYSIFAGRTPWFLVFRIFTHLILALTVCMTFFAYEQIIALAGNQVVRIQGVTA